MGRAGPGRALEPQGIQQLRAAGGLRRQPFIRPQALEQGLEQIQPVFKTAVAAPLEGGQHLSGQGPQPGRCGQQPVFPHGSRGRPAALTATGFQCRQGAAARPLPQARRQRRLQPGQTFIHRGIPAGGAQQRHQLGGGCSGGQCPARLVGDAHTLPLEQGTDTAQQHPVLCNQRHRGPACIQMIQHRGGAALRQVLKIVAQRLRDLGGRQTAGEGVLERQIRTQSQTGHTGSLGRSQKGLGQRIRSTGLKMQPGTGAKIEQGVGGRRPGVRCGPFQRHQQQRPFQLTGAALRRQHLPRLGPERQSPLR